jgi:hypothetical protein
VNGAGKTPPADDRGAAQADVRLHCVNGYDLESMPEAAKDSLGSPGRPFIYDKLTASEFLRFIAASMASKAVTWSAVCATCSSCSI